jgi:16S rRNA (adenine1518-N6/adenine1519-N6)-dimethyltransferase
MKAKKHFGQHFLVNQGVIEKILQTLISLDNLNHRRCLEIGPGPGALTKALLEANFEVHAVEIDEDMVNELKTKFASYVESKKFHILHADFLNLDPAIINNKGPWSFSCGNLPYNCGSEIVFRFLEQYEGINNFGFMLQKEVVEKFTAQKIQKINYGIPSVKFSLSCNLKQLFWIQAGSFAPPPKVESGFFSYSRLEKPLANPLERNNDYDQVSKLIQKAFGQRRKKLSNTLGKSLPTVYLDKRPEELDASDFLKILQFQKNS